MLAAVPASAPTATEGHVYDKVEAIEVQPGEVHDHGDPRRPARVHEADVPIQAGDAVGRCSRFVTLAISQPGKYRFATIAVSAKPTFDGKLTAR
jgi:hypothetical protein